MHFHCSCSCFTAFKTKATPSWCVLESSRRFSWENQQRDRRGRPKTLKPLAWGSGDTLQPYDNVVTRRYVTQISRRSNVQEVRVVFTDVNTCGGAQLGRHYLISSTRNICRNGWRTAVYFGLRPQTRCLKACWETPPTYPQRAAVQKPYHNFPFPSFTLRSLSFNYSNKYIPNIQYVTLKYMK